MQNSQRRSFQLISVCKSKTYVTTNRISQGILSPKWRKKVAMSEIKLIDGSFSAQLSMHVTEKIDDHPLWTSRFLQNDPDAVYRTHLDYLRAGADIIETGTYQASVPGFVKYLGLSEEQSITLIKKAVSLAKEAVSTYFSENQEEAKNRKILVAGSCGPYGAALHDGSEYTGNYASPISSSISKEMIMQFHRSRIQALLDANVDLLALETIPCAREAEALIELLREFPSTKAWVSFSCRTDGKSLVDGSSFQEVASSCYENALPGQIVAVGVNCIAPRYVEPLLGSLNGGKKKEDRVPLIVYPNSGEIYVGHEWKKDDEQLPLDYFVHRWLDLGTKFVGGCCRANANNIERIKIKIIEWQNKKCSEQ